MNYSLNTITDNNCTRYLLQDGMDNFYSISKLLYEILYEYKNTGNYSEACLNLNKKRTDNLLTPDQVEQGVNKAKEIISKAELDSLQTKKYIKHKIKIIKENQLHKTYFLLSQLFNKTIFLSLTLFSLAISLYFFLQNGIVNPSQLYTHLLPAFSFSKSIIAFILFLCIVLCHEIGHASAAFKYKIYPKEIGAGLYFIFPVFYTNVTGIWNLSVFQKIIVNVGGIYFQLLINCLLIACYNFNFFKDVFLLLILLNSVSILISLNPFFRYDGYWIFSDFFGIFNLRKKSTSFVKYCIKKPLAIKEYINSNKIKASLVIYSVINIGFWFFVYISVFKYLIKHLPELASLFSVNYNFTLASGGTMFTCFLIFVWFFTAIKTIYITLLKNNNHAKQQF